MPAKKSTKPISRVSAKSKKGGFKFRWWMALILVVIVGGVGLIVLRFSRASVACGTAQKGQLCDAGSIPLLMGPPSFVASTCPRTSTGQGVYCGNFNNQYNSRFWPNGFIRPNDVSTQIYQLDNNFNTTCGRVSVRNPLTAKSQDPGFLDNLRLGALLRDGKMHYLWWTSVGC